MLALRLSFSLPSSCYATMVIRELLKSSTARDYHKALGGHLSSARGADGEEGGPQGEEQA